MEFGRLFELVAIEALFQLVQERLRALHVILFRKDFLAGEYLVRVNVDGLLLLTLNQLPAEVVAVGGMAPPVRSVAVIGPNGEAARRFR